MEPLNVVLIGRSGSGKGTQAELLMKRFNYFYSLSTGDLFRDLAKKETNAAKNIKKILVEGGLPYDDLATALWMRHLAYELKEDQGLLADGFPRRLKEAQSLDSFLEFLGRTSNTFYLLLDISREEAFSRLLKRGRADDTTGAINGRLDYYEARVAEVLDYYESKGKLIKIDGERDMEAVHDDIFQRITLKK